MASSGPNNSGTIANDASFGTLLWATPGNAAASDNSYATVTIPGGSQSNYLKATNYGFSLPAATVDGLLLSVEKSATDTNATDARVRVVKVGAIGATDKSSVDA